MEVAYKSDTRRWVSLPLRDLLGINALEQLELKDVREAMNMLISLKGTLEKEGIMNPKREAAFAIMLLEVGKEFHRILSVEVPDNFTYRRQIKKQMDFKPRCLEDFRYLEWGLGEECFSGLFRFQGVEQLKRLLSGFRFPEGIIRIHTYPFSAEEILLISLTRLAHPDRWASVMRVFPGRDRWELSRAFYWFLDYMIANWGYLILNNRDFWLPYFMSSAQHMRDKLANLNHANWRLIYPNADDPIGGFNVSLIIDNTMLAMCRPGGGPITDGPASARISKEVQQAWWTGWKKLHGMKFQTVILANGMDFQVDGPVSVRHNDNYNLDRSDIENQLHLLQVNERLKFKILGDSAYSDSDYMVTGEGLRGLASIREPIEWDYKDLKTLWKYCDYKKALQLKKQPLAKIFFVCMLLRNAHTTMNGCQCSTYFGMPPPHL